MNFGMLLLIGTHTDLPAIGCIAEEFLEMGVLIPTSGRVALSYKASGVLEVQKTA